MGIAGHNRINMLLGQLQQGLLQLQEVLPNQGYLISQVKAYVQSYLVVAAAGRMQLLTHIAYAAGKQGFYIHVYVFSFHAELKLAASKALPDFLQSFDYEVSLLGVNYSLPGQHARMGYAAGNVLVIHAAVKGYGCIKIFGQAVTFFGETAAPQFHKLHLNNIIYCCSLYSNPNQGSFIYGKLTFFWLF